MELLNQEPQLQQVFTELTDHLATLQPIPAGQVIVDFQPDQHELVLQWDAQRQLARIIIPKLVYLGRLYSQLVALDLTRDQALQEPVLFPEVAFSLDLSRNGVMRLETVRQFVRYLAVMGYTHLYLYMEDTYQVATQPYQGYLRGAYSQAELQAIDDDAAQFGIEVVPCIQTLAHLDQLLKWPAYDQVREDQSTLLVDQPETYQLISQWLRQLRATFRSRRVHLGLDEANGVGRGQYLQHHPYQSQQKLISQHIAKVVDLCEQAGLAPEIWSDFLYRALDRRQAPGYYALDADLDEQAAAQLPKEVAYCYWDYGEAKEENYRIRLQRHRLFGPKVHFAGGVHIFGNLVPNYGKSWQTLAPALAACQQEQVTQVMLTTWGDDGQETSHWLALPIMQLFAERCYHEKIDFALGAERFSHCVQPQLFTSLLQLDQLNEVPGVLPENYWMANPSKYLLWQDPQVGLFDEDLRRYQAATGVDLAAYYQQQAAQLQQWPEAQGVWTQITAYYQRLAQVLAQKSTLGLRLRQAYLADDRTALVDLATQVLSPLRSQVEKLQALHYQIWQATYRPFGWEVLEARYATLASRLGTTARAIYDYLAGDTQALAALAAPRLPYGGATPLTELSAPIYRKIAFTGYN